MRSWVAGALLSIAVLLLLRPTQSLAETVPEIVETVSPAIVKIVTFDTNGSEAGQGSGFFISQEGAILTNAHVVKNAYSARVISGMGPFDSVRILYRDDSRDLALIKVETSAARPLFIAKDIALKPGERVLAIGNPFGLEKAVTEGLIGGVRNTKQGMELIQSSVHVYPGSSGGPLLDFSGQVIGITTSSIEGAENLSFSVGATTISEFLKAYNEDDRNRPMPKELQQAGEVAWYRRVQKRVQDWLLLLIGLAIIAVVIWARKSKKASQEEFLEKMLWLRSTEEYTQHLNRRHLIAGEQQQDSATAAGEMQQMLTRVFGHPPEQRQGSAAAGGQGKENAYVTFYCLKCGSKYALVCASIGKTIDCISCHAQVAVPTDSGESVA